MGPVCWFPCSKAGPTLWAASSWAWLVFGPSYIYTSNFRPFIFFLKIIREYLNTLMTIIKDILKFHKYFGIKKYKGRYIEIVYNTGPWNFTFSVMFGSWSLNFLAHYVGQLWPSFFSFICLLLLIMGNSLVIIWKMTCIIYIQN